MPAAPLDVTTYYRSGGPLVCELDAQPWLCEFWPEHELERYNAEYEVPTYAPGYFAFAGNGGGEMYALSPEGKVVCLALIGMSPKGELVIAASWSAFLRMLRNAI